jgi:DnaJ-class molecular chaperone
MTFNAYNILRVSQDASSDEIKKAYKEALLRSHPDKGGTEEQFREVQDAYNLLKDPQQFEEESDIAALIAKVCKGLWNKKRVKDLSIIVHLSVTLQEIYNGVTKKLQYTYKDNGIDKRKAILIPLIDFKNEMIYEGYGDILGCYKGDLIIKIDVTNKDIFRTDEVMGLLDLYTEIPINLMTYIFGGEIEITLPNCKKHIEHIFPLLGKNNNGSKTITIKGKGLPSVNNLDGDLIVNIFLCIDSIDTNKFTQEFKDECCKYFHTQNL